MRIAWVTPYFRDSAVGELAGRVADEMAACGHDVTVFGCGRPPYAPTNRRFVPVGEYERIPPEVLARFDAVVYNAANHPSSFPIYDALTHTPGVVVLCDRVYVHGLDAYTQFYLRRPAELESIAEELYARPGVDFVRRFRSGDASPEEFERFPFIEPLLRNARAVLVHSKEYRGLVAERWNGRIGLLHGFTVPPRPQSPPVPRQAISVGSDDFLLAFVGYVSPYRGLELLFDVLGSRPDLTARMKLALVGRIEDSAYAARLQQHARDRGLAEIMRWGLNASDDVKHSVLSNADAAYNCRTLNSEGSSASLIEEMSYGLPVIVNANGFARDIPPDAVCFVDRADMAAGVERALETLAAQPENRTRIGERAAEWVRENSSTRVYAETIVSLVEQTRPVPPARVRTTMPLVSIAIPSYNYGRHIARAIRSAQAQTYPNIEIVVSDNHSTDDSLEIIRSLAEQDPRIRYSCNESNLGAIANYHIVRDMTRGEYVVFLSADDVMYPHHVGSAIAYYDAHPECDIRHTGFTVIGENGEPLWVFEHPGFRGIRSVSARDEFGYAMAANGHVMMQTIVFPRRILDAVGDFTTEILSADTDFLFRCNRAGYRFAFDATPSVGFMQHAGSMSSPEQFIATGKQLHAWLRLYDDNLTPETLLRCVGRRRRILAVLDQAERQLAEHAKERAPELLAEHAEAAANVRRKVESIPDRLDAAHAKDPRFSIVLPTVGNVALLKRSIDSLLRQTTDSWEVIVVSSGGENLEGILRTWVSPDRLVWAQAAAAQSPGAARNAALTVSRGESIAYLDEGDVWSPDYLSSLAAVMDREHADVVRFGASAVYYHIGLHFPGDPAARDAALFAPPGAGYVDGFGLRSPLSALAHRSYCVELAGTFNETLPLFEDWEFLLRLNGVANLKKVDVAQSLVEAAFYPALAFQLLGRRLQMLPDAFNAIHALHPALVPHADARSQRLRDIVARANALQQQPGSLAALRAFIGCLYGPAQSGS